MEVNNKRTRRMWREEGLWRPPRTVKKCRVGPQRGDRLEATRPDQVWALDLQHDLTGHAMRDWCRLSGIATAFIEPGSSWQNGFAESFNGRFRDEFLTCGQFDTLHEAQAFAHDWRVEYNPYRPHGSLGDLTPEAYRQQWTNTQPALSQPLDHQAGPSHKYHAPLR